MQSCCRNSLRANCSSVCFEHFFRNQMVHSRIEQHAKTQKKYSMLHVYPHCLVASVMYTTIVIIFIMPNVRFATWMPISVRWRHQDASVSGLWWVRCRSATDLTSQLMFPSRRRDSLTTTYAITLCVCMCVCVCVCVCVRLWNVKIASNRKRCQDNEIALVIGYKVRG